LVGGSPEAWQEAFTDFYETRLKLRYLDPIRFLQANGNCQGEGFSIVAIQCSLIEFLESTEQGINYRYVRHDEKLGEFEYSSSQGIFVSFLSKRQPFAQTFDKIDAKEFYIGVRCALLHEASTKNGWRIWAKGPCNKVANVTDRILYRDKFQEALLAYIKAYGARLPDDPHLQSAFIRKFDNLCE